MKQPIYLPLRDRMVIRHAADLLAEDAKALKDSNSVDGVILEVEVKRVHDDLVATAKSLRSIATTRTNKETKQ